MGNVIRLIVILLGIYSCYALANGDTNIEPDKDNSVNCDKIATVDDKTIAQDKNNDDKTIAQSDKNTTVKCKTVYNGPTKVIKKSFNQIFLR